MASITKNSLLAIVGQINATLGNPTAPFVKAEDGSRTLAVGHLTIDKDEDKRYQLVEFTEKGIVPKNPESKSAREMESLLSGVLAGLKMAGFETTAVEEPAAEVETDTVSA